MFIPYKDLPDNARVWVYQSNRAFTIEEVEHISAKALLFTDQWTRHGANLKASFTIKYNRFLVLAVDENFNNVSGCSIDASVHFIKELEKELQLDLLNKLQVSYKDKTTIEVVNLVDFQNFIKIKKITPQTIVFNNMVTSKKDFETQWEVPVLQSWHKKYLV